ncbi:ABC transporter permease [Nevskia sp.]|uniref:ABC transporter permease n=1 Tax=Nevskia sp. TaxID=1929292 RepID=UPI003F6F7C4D
MKDMVRRIAAATWARSLEFVRDRSSLGWNLVFPILMVAGLAFVFSGPGQPLFKVAVIAPADVKLDASLHPFLGTPQVQFYREDTVAVALPKVQRHRIDLLVDLAAQPPRYWVNTQSPKGALLERLIAGSGGPALQREETAGHEIRYVDWVAPGVLGMNMMFACLFGIGYVIVRYRKNGYLKRLNATPLRAVEFLIAQLLSRLALILVVNALVFGACRLLLGLRMEGHYLDLLVVVTIGAFSMIAMGLVVSARLASEELAGGILNVISTPMMVVCGVFFSMDGAPRALQIAAEFLPLTHLLNAARAIMLDGAGLAQLGYPLAALATMSAVYLALGAALFKWRQD